MLPTIVALTARAGSASTLTPFPERSPSREPTATRTPLPTRTATPVPITLEAPTNTPTPETPLAEIQIRTPGPLSKVTSPIQVRAFLEPGARGRVQVDVLGEDGRLLTRELLIFSALPGRRVNLFVELEFEIAAVAETGRLQISTADAYGREIQRESVQVILLSEGEADINPSGGPGARLLIDAPEPDAIVQGGELLVSGKARPDNDRPLAIEVIDREGKILGSRQVQVEATASGELLPFTATIPYRVDQPTRALVVVRQRGERPPGDIRLTSVEVLLGP